MSKEEDIIHPASCTPLEAPIVPDVLWRYVKPSWLDSSGCLLPVCFDLRSEIDPPEDHVSFYEGNGDTHTGKLNSVVGFMTRRGYNLKKTGKMLSIQTQEAYQAVNEPNPIIEFIDKNRPHYGMLYLVEDDSLILEAKNILAFSAELHSYNELLSHNNSL